MDDILRALILLVLVLFVIITLQYYRKRWPVRNFPPGPTGLPLVGTLFSSGNEVFFHKTAQKLKHRYGNVFSLMRGDVPVVVINGYEAIKTVLQANKGCDFASRHGSTMYSVQGFNPKLAGVFNANFTERSQQHRRFAISSLRRFEFGKASLQVKIKQEVDTLLNHIRSLATVPHDLSVPLTTSVAGVMCQTILGCHYQHSDTEFQRLIMLMNETVRMVGCKEFMLMDFVPITRPFLQKKFIEVSNTFDEFHAITMGKVTERRMTFVEDNEPQDFLDCYLTKMTEQPDIFTLEDFKFVSTDLFTASTDTTANTLMFALLYMVVNPHVQENVYKELTQTVGPSRLPCLEDRSRLPYTIATICEVQRLANIATALPRCATVDTVLAGYSIPKGTAVMCNIVGVHIDPELWPNPDRFDPTRHLDQEGKVIKSPYLLPFGAGRRGCMGESLARMELFLFFSSLVHQFQFKLPPGEDSPRLDSKPGLTAAPWPFQVIVTNRTSTEIMR